MTRKQLKELLNYTTGEEDFFGPDEAIILDFAKAVQKAVITQVLDDVATVLQNSKQHMLLRNQAG